MRDHGAGVTDIRYEGVRKESVIKMPQPMITMYVVNLLNCGEDPEEVEAGELLEVLGGPGVGGEEGGEKSRVG